MRILHFTLQNHVQELISKFLLFAGYSDDEGGFDGGLGGLGGLAGLAGLLGAKGLKGLGGLGLLALFKLFKPLLLPLLLPCMCKMSVFMYNLSIIESCMDNFILIVSVLLLLPLLLLFIPIVSDILTIRYVYIF